VQTLFTQVAQEAMQKDLAALPKVEADAMDKFKATGGSIVAMKDLQNFITRSPDMIQIWVDKSTKDGLGEKIKELIPLQRKAAQSFANSRN
jgi:TRAP-type C4-dicarboxylate transport system substrate-binding protein